MSAPPPDIDMGDGKPPGDEYEEIREQVGNQFRKRDFNTQDSINEPTSYSPLPHNNCRIDTYLSQT